MENGQTKYRAGEWRIQKEGIVTFDSLGSCAELCGHNIEANARLIAAAPELLVALKDVLSDYLQYLSDNGIEPRSLDALQNDGINRAKAVIAKVEGK